MKAATLDMLSKIVRGLYGTTGHIGLFCPGWNFLLYIKHIGISVGFKDCVEFRGLKGFWMKKAVCVCVCAQPSPQCWQLMFLQTSDNIHDYTNRRLCTIKKKQNNNNNKITHLISHSHFQFLTWLSELSRGGGGVGGGKGAKAAETAI